VLALGVLILGVAIFAPKKRVDLSHWSRLFRMD
jgi:hypothetical protein